MPLIDTHAHLDEDAFSVDRDDVVARATAAGVAAVITIGTTAESSRRAVELARLHPAVFAAVGIQPNYTAAAQPGDWEIIEQLAREPKVVAIGETGLDRYWDYAPLELQQDYFARHVELSRRLDLPFVVHCRDAEAEVVAQLRGLASAGPLRGVMHSFTGDLATAGACLELGLYVSFAGMVTYKKNAALRSVAAAIPLDRLLVETDAPYLAPAPMRGKRNEPAYVVHTARCLAETRGLPPETLAAQTTANARALFRLGGV
ncbi:MAG TPA: TatD family hydrolase [Planctomycetaceae bacterium]|nr:TatD family hydrolase [Planctomycetaceae bacterium]